MVAIGMNSSQWATQPPEHHLYMFKDIQAHMEKTNKNFAESSHHIYKERFHMISVIGKWTSSQDLVVILINQLQDTF